MRTQKLCSGSRHWTLGEGIKMYVATGSMVWGTGFQKQASFGSGGIRNVERIREFYFATGILEWGKHISGKCLIQVEEVGIITEGRED